MEFELFFEVQIIFIQVEYGDRKVSKLVGVSLVKKELKVDIKNQIVQVGKNYIVEGLNLRLIVWFLFLFFFLGVTMSY